MLIVLHSDGTWSKVPGEIPATIPRPWPDAIRHRHSLVTRNAMVIEIGDGGRTTVLKNRFGQVGRVNPRSK